MNRFFIPRQWISGGKVSIGGEQAHQICRVLRLKPADRIIVADNSGWQYAVEIEELTGELVRGRIVDKDYCPAEPATRVTLHQAQLKTDKFEFVLQKGVELGVSAFVPFTCERCVDRKPGESKISRWEKIIREAAEQSGRCLLPALHKIISFKEACDTAGAPSVLLWEGEKSASLRKILKTELFQNSKTINVFVGPEGGFPASEADYAESRGIITAGLGHRILRAETAGFAAITAILYEKGEIG